MKFKAFGDKYNFPKNVLIDNFPPFVLGPLSDWLLNTLRYDYIIEDSFERYIGISPSFKHFLQIEFREVFPQDWNNFLKFVFEDKDRTCNIIALCLQNCANLDQANSLEYILSESGSAYEITCTDLKSAEFHKGVFDLIQRVPTSTKKFSEKAISENEMLLEAWNSCFSRKPDYEKTVSRCSDFLEAFFKKKYFPDDPKPQLKKFIHDFENNPERLQYKGSTIVSPKSMITSLLSEVSNIRGQHLAGKGRKPTRDEAEFVLNTTIYIWNLHNGIK
jgi:hypothetical protein